MSFISLEAVWYVPYFAFWKRHLVYTSSNNSRKLSMLSRHFCMSPVRSFFQLKKAPVLMKTNLVLGFRPRFTLYVSADTKSFVHTGYFTHCHQIFPITSLTIVEQLCYQQFKKHKSAVANVWFNLRKKNLGSNS